jgi:hypothetical protein
MDYYWNWSISTRVYFLDTRYRWFEFCTNDIVSVYEVNVYSIMN